MDPYEIFCEDEWEMIFDKIEAAEDKLNLMKAHPKLREQFQQKELGLQFLLALPILMDYFERKQPDSARQLNWERRQILYTSRLVSRSSCKVIDKWLDAQWKKESNEVPLILNYSQASLMFRPELNMYLERFGEMEMQPQILSRSACASVPSFEDEEDFIQNDEDEDAFDLEEEIEDNRNRNMIFSKIGSHLKKLYLHLSANQENVRRWFREYRRVLKATPNIKRLSGYCSPAALSQGITLPALPDLPFLTHLSLCTDDEKDSYLEFSLFERYFPQLLEFELVGFYAWKDGCNFPKLKTLKLETVYVRHCPWHKKMLLNIFKSLNAPALESLEVEIAVLGKRFDVEREARHLLRVGTMSLNKRFKDSNVKWQGNDSPCIQGRKVRKLHFTRL